VSSVTFGKVFTHTASVTKQYKLGKGAAPCNRIANICCLVAFAGACVRAIELEISTYLWAKWLQNDLLLLLSRHSRRHLHSI